MILLAICNFSAFAAAQSSKEDEHISKVKRSVAKLKDKSKAKVYVKLKDGTKLKGYVIKVNENSFVLTDAKSGAPTEIIYSQVKQVRNNPQTGLVIGGILGGIVSIIVLVVAGRKG